MIIDGLEKDLKYIENDIIAKQANGLYCKYSRLAKCITITNLSKENHLKYWVSQYKVKYNPKNKPAEFKEAKRLITKTINKKFKSGLFDLDKVIELELKSNDMEKDKLISTITSLEKPVSNTLVNQNK